VNRKLIDFAQIISGHSFRGAIMEQLDGDFLVLQTKNIMTDGSIDHDFVRIHIDNYREKSSIQKGDVLLSNRGNFKAAVYQDEVRNVIVASSIYILRTDSSVIIPEYLAIFLNSKTGQRILQEHNRGAFIKSLPKSSLINLQIPVLDMKQQQKVVKIHNNYLAREKLYLRRAKLQKNIADNTIYNLITS
jgi:hypothetical protein